MEVQEQTHLNDMPGRSLLTLPVSSRSCHGRAVTAPVVSLKPQTWLIRILPLPSFELARYCTSRPNGAAALTATSTESKWSVTSDDFAIRR